MEEKLFFTAAEVAKILGISLSKSYQICKDLNQTLSQKGFITLPGKVSAKFFIEKIYGGNTNVCV